MNDLHVARLQRLGPHLGDDVRRHAGVVSRELGEQTVLAREPRVQPGPTRRVQQPDHGRDDVATLNELHQPLERRGRVAVKPHDESTAHPEARVLHTLHRGGDVPVHILRLAALQEALLIRGLDADEHGVEAGTNHERHGLLIVRQVDRYLGGEGEGVLPVLHPVDDDREDLTLELDPVADEVVVGEEHAAPPAALVEALELAE